MNDQHTASSIKPKPIIETDRSFANEKLNYKVSPKMQVRVGRLQYMINIINFCSTSLKKWSQSVLLIQQVKKNRRWSGVGAGKRPSYEEEEK